MEFESEFLEDECLDKRDRWISFYYVRHDSFSDETTNSIKAFFVNEACNKFSGDVFTKYQKQVSFPSIDFEKIHYSIMEGDKYVIFRLMVDIYEENGKLFAKQR